MNNEKIGYTLKEIMENPDLATCIAEDVEDFDADTPVAYEVWALGYGENDMVTDAEMLIEEFTDPDLAIEKAKQLTLADIVYQAEDECDAEDLQVIKRISIEVETVIPDAEDEEGTINIGTIFRKDILDISAEDLPIEPEPYVDLYTKDYEILEDGMLKVRYEVLKEFNKNDIVKLFFKDEQTADYIPLLTYRIVSKAEYEDGDYWLCDFIY